MRYTIDCRDRARGRRSESFCLLGIKGTKAIVLDPSGDDLSLVLDSDQTRVSPSEIPEDPDEMFEVMVKAYRAEAPHGPNPDEVHILFPGYGVREGFAVLPLSAEGQRAVLCLAVEGAR